MSMHIFIDTNIFLGFYSYTKDRLEELNKLISLIDKGEVILYVPSQLVEEIARNRERVIRNAYKDLADVKLEKGFPYFFQSHDDFSKIMEALNSFNEVKEKIIQELHRDISTKQLKADLVISEILKKGRMIESSEYIDSAKTRIHIGNPPGKEGSLGDAINWECLLASVPDREDLIIISKDSDYQSPLNKERLSGYLQDEWEERKKAKVDYCQSLAEWAEKYNRDVSLKIEDEISALIDKLSQSCNFADTHSIIASLERYDDFTPEQVEQLMTVAAVNSQVRWILSDADVKEFYSKIILGKDKILNQELLSIIQKRINE